MWGRRRAWIAPGLLAALVAAAAPGDAQAAISISGAGTPVDEGTSAHVTVTRDSGLFETSVDVQLSGTGPSPAACPQDAAFATSHTCRTTVALPGTLFGPVSRTVEIPLVADGLDEAEEIFQATLVDHADIGSPSSATVHIADGDPAPVLSIGDAPAVEEDHSGAAFELPVTLSAVSARPVSATVTLGGAATVDEDVTRSGFTDTVTLPAGTRSTRLKLLVVPDDIDEPDEDVTLTLSAPINGSVGVARSAKGTILNDDVPTVSIADVEGAEGTGDARTPFAFALELSNPSTRTIAVSAATEDRQAEAGRDYDATVQRVVFAPGTTTGSLIVGVIADAAHEEAETFGVRLLDPAGTTLGRTLALGRISDDDRAPDPGSPAGTPSGEPAGRGDADPAAIEERPRPGDDRAPVSAAGGSRPSASVPAGGPTPPAVSRAGALRLSKVAFARPSTVTGRLACPSASRGCRGRVTLFSVPQRSSRVKALRKELKLGAVAFDVTAGRTATWRVKLSKATLATIRRGKQVTVKAFAVSRAPGGAVSAADAKGVVRP